MIVRSSQKSALSCSDLSVGYGGDHGILSVVRNVSLNVASGAALGIVGESGSGKSTLALALANCLPPGGVVTGGTIAIGGDVLGGKSVHRSRLDIARRMSVVFQNPASALDPSQRIVSVFLQRLRLLDVPQQDRIARAKELLLSVKLRNIDQVLASYPHQLSGGMQQRVIIALALANDPAVLVLDEPTTGLDATVASEILDLLKTLRRERRAGLVFISHDIAQVHNLCDDIAVMYGGELVEQGPADQLISNPRHPYTRSLLACLPSVKERRELLGIKGAPPSPSQLSDLNGCLFAPRCESATDFCFGKRPEPTVEDMRHYRCHHPAIGKASPISAISVAQQSSQTQVSHAGLKVEGLDISYGQGKHRRTILKDVSFEVRPGEILAVIGESGSGKSTLLKGLVGLVAPDAGSVSLNGETLSPVFSKRSAKCLSDIRIVFQNPVSALNRRRKIGHQIGRCLTVATGKRATEADWKALADKVRLPHYNLNSLAKSLSGGLLQRVAIACALAGKPQVIIFDEPTSALDVSVQAGILNLIAEQVRQTNAAAIFVTHDLAVVRQIADRAMVLLNGAVVESGLVSEMFEHPKNPYTARLLYAFSEHSAAVASTGQV